MPLPPELETHGGWIATGLGALMGTAALGYNFWRRVTGDLRGDRREKQIDTGYTSAMHNLQAEVERLSTSLANLSIAFSREQAARREAEELAILAERRAENLRHRVAVLEAELAMRRSSSDGG